MENTQVKVSQEKPYKGSFYQWSKSGSCDFSRSGTKITSMNVLGTSYVSDFNDLAGIEFSEDVESSSKYSSISQDITIDSTASFPIEISIIHSEYYYPGNGFETTDDTFIETLTLVLEDS